MLVPYIHVEVTNMSAAGWSRKGQQGVSKWPVWLPLILPWDNCLQSVATRLVIISKQNFGLLTPDFGQPPVSSLHCLSLVPVSHYWRNVCFSSRPAGLGRSKCDGIVWRRLQGKVNLFACLQVEMLWLQMFNNNISACRWSMVCLSHFSNKLWQTGPLLYR